MIPIHSLEEYQQLLSDSTAVLCYFSTAECSVCKVLKPKVIELVSGKFPEMKAAWIDISLSPRVAGQNSIFCAPTILVYFEGTERLRRSRNISIWELEKDIGRIYFRLF